MDMVAYNNMLNDNDITLLCSGPLWNDGIGEIAAVLKRKLDDDGIPLETSLEVFSVFVEQMNNMLMHSAEAERIKNRSVKNGESPKGSFVFGKKCDAYFIHTGNTVTNESVGFISGKLDYLNSLDKPALRKYYKEQLWHEDPDSGSKGAGLGFIEIARRMSSKIKYSFEENPDGYSFFTMYVEIGGEDKNVT